ncbi:MAG: hypothetical protein M1838_002247 [Thelocarpon superellum]|nr:MAG: hypothetical protein M1838_002247 [Thelocarpon superellum]
MSEHRIKSPGPAPSEELTEALRHVNAHDAIPPHPSKKSLSYARPSSHHQRSPSLDQWPLTVEPTGPAAWTASLPGIVAAHLRHVQPALSCHPDRAPRDSDVEAALRKAYPPTALRYLHARGYDEADVVTWAWILTAPTAEEATRRLWWVEHRRPVGGGSPTPPPAFLALFLLRRQHVSARSLQALMAFAWARISGVTPTPPLSEPTIMTLVVRLLRHARRVWPEAIVNIAAMMCAGINGRPSPRRGREVVVASRLTGLYNRMLSLLAVPAAVHPFLTVPYRQRAQFDLIRHMARFRPPLSITAEGYRAVIRVQAAHKKTPRERQWTTRKARSWPPWPESKLGIDVIRDEDGSTRTVEAIQRMNEAGYASPEWEAVARVIAGWDTDGSPTVQTRSIPPRSMAPTAVLAHPSSAVTTMRHEGTRDELWVARIRATRTVDEAWACFARSSERHRRASSDVYLAMFEKVVYEELRIKGIRNPGALTPTRMEQIDGPVPGDGREVLPSAVSPQEAVYLPSPAPSLMGLFGRMLQEHVQPSDRCLAFIVSRAGSVEEGQRFLHDSRRLSDPSYRALTDQGPTRDEHGESVEQSLACIPDRIFSAYIILLCRFAVPTARRHGSSSVREVYWLMRHRALRSRPAWNALFRAVTRQPRHENEDRAARLRGATRSCVRLQRAVQDMYRTGLELDTDGFHVLCLQLERTLSVLRDTPRADQMSLEAQTSEQVWHESLPFLHQAFASLVGPWTLPAPGVPAVTAPADLSGAAGIAIVPQGRPDPAPQPPILLAMPGPTTLHVYVRVLGLVGDIEMMERLVQWMDRFAPDLAMRVGEAHGGPRWFRAVLVAIRFFLETAPVHSGVDEIARGGAPDDDAAQRIRHLVERHAEWGGWPDDDEMAVYGEYDASSSSDSRYATAGGFFRLVGKKRGGWWTEDVGRRTVFPFLHDPCVLPPPLLYQVSAARAGYGTTMPSLSPSIPLNLARSVGRRSGYVRQSSTTAAPASLISVTNIPAPHTGSIRILSLNRPAARNAISRRLLADLRHETLALQDEGQRGQIRAMVLTSEIDACFCAGADLKERAGFTAQETSSFLDGLRDTFTLLSRLPMPTIAAVSSLALGGGLELALTTRLRVFASTAQVGLPETRLGIIPGAGGTYRLPAVIGLQRARDLILTGRRVAGPEAYFLGVCDRLVEVLPEDEAVPGRGREMVLAEAVRLAREICDGAPLAIHAAMEAVEAWPGLEPVENAAYAKVVGTRDRDEALQAFREKRRPMFQGR